MRGSAEVGREPAAAGTRDVVRLAWPAVLSFLTANSYRVIDQYWVEGLGPEAQAAIGASFFVVLLNFGLYFIVVAGMLPLVARATGAGDEVGRERAIGQAILMASALAVAIAVIGSTLAGRIPGWLGMQGVTADHATVFLRTMYIYTLPMALAPLVDNVFLGMGNTRVPLLLQVLAVSGNVVLNPCLIYGRGPFPALGMQGAALSTVISRAVTVTLGLWILSRWLHVRWVRGLRPSWELAQRILGVGVFSSLSILIYACVYLALFRVVLSPLGRDAMAGFSIGFNAFEGVSFPFYIGVAMAGSSLVGRNLGAGATELAREAVRSARRVGAITGLAFASIFLLVAPALVPVFAGEPAVAAQAALYVRILAFSQLFVAIEAVNEKVLLGAGHTKPIFWISVPANVLRVPLAWLLALGLGWGTLGVWWAINLTSLIKACLFHHWVDRGRWLGVRETAALEAA